MSFQIVYLISIDMLFVGMTNANAYYMKNKKLNIDWNWIAFDDSI